MTDASREATRTDGRVCLRPVLGRWQLFCLGIGAIIGSGIFVIPGPATAQFAGPAIILSFAIAAVGCALAGLCYAELAAMHPVAGSAYAYASHAFGRLPGWLIGWLLVLEYSFAAALVAQAFGGYAASLFHFLPPTTLAALKNVAPILMLLLIAGLVMRGVELSARLNVVFVLVKIGVIVIVILFGIGFVDRDRWIPFVPTNTGHWGEFGWSGVLRAAGIVFYTYLGFDTVSVAAQEARRPQHDVPFALIGSLALCSILFMSMMAVITGLVDYRALNVANPVAVAIRSTGPSLAWLAPVVEIGAMLSMVSVLLVILMAQSRILFAIASDGLLPKSLAVLHPRWGTPVMGTAVTAFVAGLLATLAPIALLGQMVSIGVLCAFVAVAAAVIVLRRRQPDVPRPFRAPWVPVLPIASMIVCSYMAIGLPSVTWIRFVVWLVVGFAIYWWQAGRMRVAKTAT